MFAAKNQFSLSVIMPNYNYSHYLGEALDSVFSQSFSPTEVIVVDDASTDDSVAIIKKFQQKYPSLILLQNEENRGALYSTNRALQAASSDYVFPFASDDKVLPGFFEAAMKLLTQYPQAGLFSAESSFFDGQNVLEPGSFLCDKGKYFTPKETRELFIKGPFRPPFYSHCQILKRELMLQNGGYRASLNFSCDTFLDIVIGFRTGFCYLPQALTMIRNHPHRLSNQSFTNKKLARETAANMINALSAPEYEDVFSSVSQNIAGILMYPGEVLTAVLANKEYRSLFSLRLLKLVLLSKLRLFILGILPLSIVSNIRKALRRLKGFKG